MYPKSRMRRYRTNETIRRMVRETILTPDDLILPVFVVPGKGRHECIDAMPGVERMSVDLLPPWVESVRCRGVLVFGVPDESEKDENGSQAIAEDGLVPRAIGAIKSARSDIAVITDVCLCAYTSHGHCGIIQSDSLSPLNRSSDLSVLGKDAVSSHKVDNDQTITMLARMATAHAVAGADMVAPSAMMDGQVLAIRESLEALGLFDTSIMAYAAKYASCFYGPFRDAAHSAPGFGDRRSYQIQPANRREAIQDALLDEAEGADWLMVKPAMPYLDVLSELRLETQCPLAAYQVSGEYAMLKQASNAGAFDEKTAVLESLTCIKRAGADAIITYYANDVCQWLQEAARG